MTNKEYYALSPEEQEWHWNARCVIQQNVNNANVQASQNMGVHNNNGHVTGNNGNDRNQQQSAQQATQQQQGGEQNPGNMVQNMLSNASVCSAAASQGQDGQEIVING